MTFHSLAMECCRWSNRGSLPLCAVAPKLEPSIPRRPPRLRHALLLNPFYPKDPHASFGKHVLTPTLALTSVAASTPRAWSLTYWDENLLQGPPPWEPFPQVVGITVHLTFAQRAFELARWYRRRGAVVVLGGLHVLSCPDECALMPTPWRWPRVCSFGARFCADVEAGTLKKVYTGSYRQPYRDDPAHGATFCPVAVF